MTERKRTVHKFATEDKVAEFLKDSSVLVLGFSTTFTGGYTEYSLLVSELVK